MKNRMLLLTSPIDETQSAQLLRQLKQDVPGVKLSLVARLAAGEGSDSSGARDPALTSRQTQVLRGMADGSGMKSIARQLGISPKTVETHRQHLMKRLGIGHIPGLLRYALQTGVVPASWLMERD